ncbi:ATPase domain-containing protein [Aquibacillus rhizosphaerae]|uniref:Gas vesicle protein GvpD n=1 Tax=Aquibacillus rhizosphaerae TaxID=3051431 RepID=A0ABT7LBG0_9BACI|nr:ATPase domain-containing protein [Aquibacillus sp. LR5S19]MDL4843209.1 gas vesicle protein GvpD [Aquibacillus sp. LR5S19]
MKSFLTTGISGLNTLLNGGYPESSSILLEGPPGSGKTTVGVQFLMDGAKQNQPGVYLSFEESPEQIYSNMEAFGWNLREYEEKGLLRIVGVTPEIFYDDLLSTEGIFEHLVEDIGCKRLVLDSLSLLKYLFNEDVMKCRNRIYTFRNILRKKNITALIINEENKTETFEQYVFDGVIKLSHKRLLDDYLQRTLEITKMRGTSFLQGEHIYRFMTGGIHLILKNRMVKNALRTDNIIPTGVPDLDNMLEGGIPKGEVFTLDIDSKSNHKLIVIALIASQLRNNGKVFLQLPDDISYNELALVLEKYNFDLYSLLKERVLVIMDQFNRMIQTEMEPFVVKVDELNEEEYMDYIKDTLFHCLLEQKKINDNWIIIYDINSSLNLRGEKFVKSMLPVVTSLTRSLELTSIRICNTSEIKREIGELTYRKSTGVFKMWSDEKYQYIKLAKSPHGHTTQPYIIEPSNKTPFFVLV